MALHRPINAAKQATTPSRMKKAFVTLCVLLCLLSLFLYSNVSVSWLILNSPIGHNLMPLLYQSENFSEQFLSQTSTRNNAVNNASLPPWKNRRFAIFACSIHATILAYSFYTPLTAACWKRIGYESIVVFVGDFNKPNVLTPRLRLTRNYLKRVGAHVIDVQCNESYSIKLSQLVRVFVGFLPDSIVKDDDNILTGDSDLIPLKASAYQPKNGTDGYIFNAFCCGKFERRGKSYTMFPMGHIFLQKKVWRAMVMESPQRAELLVDADKHTQYLLSEQAPFSADLISLYGRQEFKEVFDQGMIKGDAAWHMDQVLCSMLLNDYREKHRDFKVEERGHGGRLDRVEPMKYWDRNDFRQFVDAHLKHDEILEEANWRIFNKLITKLFNIRTVILFNDYYKQYVIIDKVLGNQTKS